MINRGRLPQAVADEFEHLFAKLRGFLSQTFDSDGNLIVADPNLAVFGIGDIKPSAAITPQAGWLACDGAQVSRVTYKSLFDTIGTTWGVGDGSTTFNVPDLRQKFLLGKAASGTGNTLGATGGAIDHTHSVNVGSHTHTISADGTHNHSGVTSTTGDHSHTVNSHDHTFSGPTSIVTTGTTGLVTTGATGLNVAAVDHKHDVISGNTSAASPGTDTQGSHSHTINSDGSHNHGGTTGSSGSAPVTSDAANPPYAVVNYFIFSGV
jgi:microcystin-dependent protein